MCRKLLPHYVDTVRLSGGVGLEPLTFKSDVYLANHDAAVSPPFNVHEILVLESGK